MTLDSVALFQVIIAVVTWFVVGGGILYYLSHKTKPPKAKKEKKSSSSNKSVQQKKKMHQKKKAKPTKTALKKKRSHTNKKMRDSNHSIAKPNKQLKKSKSTNDVIKKSLQSNKLEHKELDEEHKTDITSQKISVDSMSKTTMFMDIIETKQQCETEEKYNLSRAKTVNIQILNQLQTINTKFDSLIDAINAINQTLQQSKHQKHQLIHHEADAVAVGKESKCIEIVQFVLSLPFKLIFNIKTILIFLLLSTIAIYLYRNELNNNFGINVDGIGQWIIDHYILPQQTIQRYLMTSDENIHYIQQYNKDIQRLNVELIDKWKQYQPKYDQYNNAFQKQLFYSAENDDETIRQLVLIGVTGSGKSLFGNRLSGYRGDVESNGYFVVSGDVSSCTKNISKLIVYNLHNVNISILDTPGIFDTEDNDIIHQHNLIKYLKGSDGVNTFLLLVKKERLSKFIQNMLQQFEDKFGDEFWSHLMFVVNFWNKRDEIGWNEWKIDFILKIRTYFNLQDKNKYPLHIVGLNNYGSYRLEIARDLIPNIPATRLNCDDFKSPLESLKNETSKLYHKIKWLVNDRMDRKQKINEKCNELKGIINNLKWFSNKISMDEQNEKIDRYYDIIHSGCENFINSEIEDIENELGDKDILNEENVKDLAYLESESINYNDFLLHKLSYWTDSNSQYLVNCINQTMKWILNEQLFVKKEHTTMLFDSKQLCDELIFVNIQDVNISCCHNSNLMAENNYITDDGLRFIQ